jgi:hypothetical protein
VKFQPGEANPLWRGDTASYSAFHKRVVAVRGRADHCSLNCSLCHFKYDGKAEAQQGSKNPVAKLTETMVLEARCRYAAGETQRALAREYGVSAAGLCQAISGKNWGWLKD